MDSNFLKPEDYIEPRCLLCENPYGVTSDVKPVPQQRIIDKMNDYMSRRDYAGAEKHLLFWLGEAVLGHDLRGCLLIHNELVGHYRKTAEREKAFKSAEEALALLIKLEMDGTVSAGTTYINIATAYNAFGENDKAISLFKKAQAAYESNTNTAPHLLGGLYNNMGLTYAAMRCFTEAYEYYNKAIEYMAKAENGALEQAITYLNTANAVEDEIGMEKGEKRIYELLDKAYELLDSPSVPRDGYYAFVCEKCAPTFLYYGYFLAADELKKRSEAIYERN